MASYEQNKDSKLWSVRFREVGEDGKPHNMRLSGYKLKKDAHSAYIVYVQEAEKQRKTAKSVSEGNGAHITFSEMADNYLEFQKPRVKESSYYDISARINNHLRPALGDKMFDEITPLDIMQWQNGMTSHATSYVIILRRTLSSIYHYAEKYYDARNIMSKVDTPRDTSPKSEMLYWTQDEFEQFIQSVEDPSLNMYFKTLYIGGMRRGEASALLWEDIDEHNKTISITKSITNKTKGAAYAVTTPKNHSSVRTIKMPDKYMSDLLRLKDDNYKPKSYVFSRSEGTDPIASSTIDYKFKEAIKLSGVKNIRVHDLRHSCASLLISTGISIVAVSKRLGHKNIEQTLNTYSHMMPQDETKILSVFSDI